MKCDTIADLERFLKIQEQAMGPSSAEVATTASKLAALYYQAGQFDSSEQFYRRALQIRQNLTGFHRTELHQLEESLARVLKEKEYQRRSSSTNPFAPVNTFQSFPKICDPRIGESDKTDANNNGGKNQESQSGSSSYRPIGPRPAGYTGVSSTDTLPSLPTVENRQKITSPNLMRDTIRETEVELDLLRQMVGHEHPSVADLLTQLADLYCRLRLYSKMEPILIEALRIREACCGADHLSVSTELKNLARLYLAQERFAIAEPLFKRALSIRERVFGRDHMRVADLEEQYASLLRKTNRSEQAEQLERHVSKVRGGASDCVQPKQSNSIIFKSI
jgi:tetratricopeptide (TPR) repeat protein